MNILSGRHGLPSTCLYASACTLDPSKNNDVLMGRRVNNPAKDKLFVPGGRIYKNEKIIDAFYRILTNETGLSYNFHETKSLGLYEHFYDVTNWSTNECSTHYIIEARFFSKSYFYS